MKYLALTLVTILTIGQTYTRRCSSCDEWEVYNISSDFLVPVCGKNGLTYKSECYARCNEVEALYEGPCNLGEGSFPCNCDGAFNPVMDIMGNMYRNKCIADCSGV